MKRETQRRWRRGSVGVMGGLLALPLAALAGLAVDGARLWMLQNRLQMALDSAALVAARESTTGSGVTDGTALFWSNFGRTSKTTNAGYMGAVATAPAVVLPDSNTVQMTASATLSTPFLALLGMPQVSLAATTTGKRTVTGLELSLVLDSSETMTVSNNMAALRQAASNLVNIVYGTPDTVPNLWVSVVPYAGAVNLGAGNAGWLVPGSLDETQYQNTTWMGCVQARAGGEDQTDANPASAPFMPFLYLSTRGHYFNGTRTVTGDDDWSVSHITESQQSTYGDTTVGPNLGCPAAAVLPLTASKTTVLNTIAGLQATYRDGIFANLGLQAGWFTLSPNWQGQWGTANSPLAYGTPNNQKVVVFMTGSISAYNDWAGGAPGQAASTYTGATTDSDYSAYGRLSANAFGITIPHTGNLTTDFKNANIAAASAIETRIGTLCTAMKSKGVVIYAVAYAVSDPGTLAAWQSCASKPENFFNSPTQTALKTAFQQIGEQLASLWLSQ
jgi:Flp pilus assembly protein TadG